MFSYPGVKGIFHPETDPEDPRMLGIQFLVNGVAPLFYIQGTVTSGSLYSKQRLRSA
jgi:hypothetical protein